MTRLRIATNELIKSLGVKNQTIRLDESTLPIKAIIVNEDAKNSST